MAEERFRYIPSRAVKPTDGLAKARMFVIWALSFACCANGAATHPPPPTDLGPPPPERGVALGLFSQDPDYRYRKLIGEVGATGASHISLTWVWWQENVRATEIRSVSGWSATEAQLRDSIRYARQLDLHVTVFPIVRLKTSTRNEWRGRIAPDDEDQWWQSYEAFILKAAVITKEEGAQRLSVGSELLTRERMRDRWIGLIDRVRIAAPGVELMYSANWDHFRPVRFWDALDVVGLTAYWELTKDLNASTSTLAAAWDPVLKELQDWSLRVQRPLVLTEVGYPSLDGGAAWPWDETRRAAPDLEEQRRAYLAFIQRFAGQPWLQGVYWWNWFGFGGPDDTNYTPRGKPSGDLIRAWYTQPQTEPKPQRASE